MSDIVLKDSSFFKEVPCNTCKHFQRGVPYFHCAAFSKIPDEILEGKIKHNVVLPGQKNDIVYEKYGDKD